MTLRNSAGSRVPAHKYRSVKDRFINGLSNSAVKRRDEISGKLFKIL